MSTRNVGRKAEKSRPRPEKLIQNVVGKNGCRTECHFKEMEL